MMLFVNLVENGIPIRTFRRERRGVQRSGSLYQDRWLVLMNCMSCGDISQGKVFVHSNELYHNIVGQKLEADKTPRPQMPLSSTCAVGVVILVLCG